MPAFITEPQRQHRKRLVRAADDVKRSARRASQHAAEARAAAVRHEDLTQRHPEYADHTQRHRTWLALLLWSAIAAVIIEPVLTAPIAEHLLHHYAKLGSSAANIWKWVASIVVCAWELGLAVMRERAQEDDRTAGAIGWGIASFVPIAAMLMLVGLTQSALDQRMAADAAAAVSLEPTDQSSGWSPLVYVMMLFTFGVHMWVAYGPHSTTLAYFTWRCRSWACRTEQTNNERAERRHSQAAGDRFADYIAERDAFIAAYPTAPLPTPHWGSESTDVLRAQYGYDVIQGPAPTQNAPRTAPASPPAPTVDGPTENDLLREMMARRVKDMDGEVAS